MILKKKTAGLLAAVAVAVLAVGACSANGASASFDANSVECAQVATQLASAQSDLSSAQAALEKDSGTPNENPDKDAITSAQAKVDALGDRQEDCVAAAADSSAGSPTDSAAVSSGSPSADPTSASSSSAAGADDAAEAFRRQAADDQKEHTVLVSSDGVNCTALAQKFGYKTVPLTQDAKSSETPFFLIGANTPTSGVVPKGQNHKLWDHGVSAPLKPASVAAQQAVFCTQPDRTAVFMNRIGKEKIFGKTFAELNPWLKAQGDIANATKWAQSCMTDVVAKHDECVQTMSLAATLLGTFGSPGVQQVEETTWNVWLPYGAAVGRVKLADGNYVSKVPAFGLAPKQEINGHFLVFQDTAKNGGCWAKFGFNVGTEKSGVNGGDDRMAGLPCVAPKPPPAKPKPSPSPTPGHQSVPTTSSPTPVTHGCEYYGTCPTSSHPSTPTTAPSTPTTAPSTPPTRPSTPTTKPSTSTKSTPPTTPKSTPPTTPTTRTSPPKTCYSVYGPAYNGTYPNCHKAAVVTSGGHTSTVVPPPPSSAPGPNPSPVPVTVTTTNSQGSPTTSVEPTSSECYDPTNGLPVPPGTPGAWCS